MSVPGARARAFSQVDVFSAVALKGNGLAVVHDGTGLSDDRMAAFARWTQLAETTFLLPPTHPEADYRVRIFTPGRELPFAGHPTLGSCHAWLAAGGVPRLPGVVVQECGVGLVAVRRGERLAFAAPPVVFEPAEEALLQRVCAALGLDRALVLDAAWMNNGPRQLTLRLPDAAAVLALAPDFSALKAVANVGVVGPHPPGGPAQFEVRYFLPANGVEEDPVTGSLNAKIAQWLIGSGRAPEAYVAAQGTAIGRAGRVFVRRDGADIWIGGDVTSCISGQVIL